jgi:hypothetical protein
VRRSLAWAVLAAAVLAAGPACPQDDPKAECHERCEEALRSCKAGCRPERDSGTYQESDAYADCDGGCHDTYAACKRDCETR